MVTPFNFLRNCLFSKKIAPFSIPPATYACSNFSATSTTLVISCLRVAVPVGVRWHMASLPVIPHTPHPPLLALRAEWRQRADENTSNQGL